jgi:hypothetical protein
VQEQLSFFDPISTVTGQTGWSKEEGDERLKSIRARQREYVRQRFNATFNDRRD